MAVRGERRADGDGAKRDARARLALDARLRHGASLAFERDVSRSKTIWLTHRPAMRTASNTPAIIHPEEPFV